MSAYARRAIAERQRQHQIKSLLSGNNHTLIQMSSAEFVDYIISVKMKRGMTRAEAVDSIDNLLQEHDSLPASWNRHKEGLKTLGSWFPVLDDVKALTLLAVEMQRQGNVFGKFKVKVYGNAPAVIINSYPGLKAHLSGTRYLASNPKLFTIGVGKLSANKAIKGGFVINIVFSIAFHFIEQVVDDDATWHHFVAGVSVDLAVALSGLLATGIILKFAAGIGGAAVIASATIPLIVVIGAGVVFTGLSNIFSTKPMVDAVVEELRRVESNWQDKVGRIEYRTRKIQENYRQDPNEFMKKLFGIPTFHFSY